MRTLSLREELGLNPYLSDPKTPSLKLYRGDMSLRCQYSREKPLQVPEVSVLSEPIVLWAKQMSERANQLIIYSFFKNILSKNDRVSIILQLTILWEKQTSRLKAEALVRVTSGVCLWWWWWGGYQKSLPKAVTLSGAFKKTEKQGIRKLMGLPGRE